MCIAHKQQRWEGLLRLVAGAILISCPHSQSDDLSQWQTVELIVKKYAKHRITVSQELARSITADCLCFEEQFREKDVLSFHEDAESSTGRAFWHNAVVSRLKACTGVHYDADQIAACWIQFRTPESQSINLLRDQLRPQQDLLSRTEHRCLEFRSRFHGPNHHPDPERDRVCKAL